MPDRVKFIETLAELADYAEMNGGVLTKAEVEEAFREVELKKEQYDLIYRYLFDKKITIQGIRLEAMEDAKRPGQDNGQRQKSEQISQTDSAYLKMYLQELEALPKLSETKRLELVMLLLDGRKEVLPDLLNASLYQVVELARTYRGRGVFLEDLIQEGNLGLMQALEELTGRKGQKSPLSYIRESIQYAMEQYIDSQMARGDEEEKVVAKLALLHEAAKALSKENGVLPTVKELSEYTKISEAEIADMVSLSKDVDFYK